MSWTRPVAPHWRDALVLGLAFAFWTAFGLLAAGQIYVRELTNRTPVAFGSLFNIVYFYWGWALLTPLVLRLSHDAANAARPWWSRVVRQVPGVAVVVLLQAMLYAVFQHIDGRPADSTLIDTFTSALVRHAAGNVFTYAMLVATLAGAEIHRTARDREREAANRVLEGAARESNLQATMVRMQMQALQAQLQPHFLFNTLNMISALVAKDDREGANRAIARLGELLRVSLDRSTAQEVPLSTEMALTRPYLDIVQQRFGDRLVLTTHIDADALGCEVPTLLLQPLIENAIRHGVGMREGIGHVDIAAHVRGAELVLVVSDDGPGFDVAGTSVTEGVGLANVAARLRGLYGDAASLETGNKLSGGAVVTVSVPVRQSPSAPVADGRAIA